MDGKSSDDEVTITTSDLQNRWDDIKVAVQRQAEQRVMGLSSLAVGGILVGVGVLGLAFWLGRRSALPAPTAPVSSESAGPSTELRLAARGRDGISISRAVEPAVTRAVDAAVQLGIEALTKRLRRDETES